MSFAERLRVIAKTSHLLRTQWWPGDRIESYQDARLREILSWASSRVPYYRDLGIANDGLPPRQWLNRFPVLSKAQVQCRTEDLCSKDEIERGVFTSRTSGTSGEPTTTYFDKESWLLCKYALKARRVFAAIRPFGQRLLFVSERADGAEFSAPGRRLADPVLAARRLYIDSPVSENVGALIEFRPTVLQGPPSYLEYMAEECGRSDAPALRIPVAFTSSELLTKATRDRLESSFGSRVIDVYGSTEFKEMAVQCPYGRYHINFESVFLEERADPSTGFPRLLITTLVNKAMPLIRFDIGDHGSIGFEPCECGRESPHIKSLHGREAELLRFDDGRAISPFVLTTLIGRFSEVRNFSVLHTAPDQVVVKVFAEPSLPVHRQTALLDEIRAHLPAGTSLTLAMLETRLPPGKRIAVRRTFDAVESE